MWLTAQRSNEIICGNISGGEHTSRLISHKPCCRVEIRRWIWKIIAIPWGQMGWWHMSLSSQDPKTHSPGRMSNASTWYTTIGVTASPSEAHWHRVKPPHCPHKPRVLTRGGETLRPQRRTLAALQSHTHWRLGGNAQEANGIKGNANQPMVQRGVHPYATESESEDVLIEVIEGCMAVLLMWTSWILLPLNSVSRRSGCV